MKYTLVVLAMVVSTAASAQYPSTGDAKKNETRATDERPMKSDMPGGEAKLNEQETITLAKLHHTNQMEIQMGQLAQKYGQSKKVKQFGETLVKDHTLADRQITEFAKRRNIDLSMPAPKDEAEQAERQSMKDTQERLESMRGAQFDALFARTMMDGHQKAVNMVQATLDQTRDKQLHGLLSKVLPVLQEHLRISESLDKASKNV